MCWFEEWKKLFFKQICYFVPRHWLLQLLLVLDGEVLPPLLDGEVLPLLLDGEVLPLLLLPG